MTAQAVASPGERPADLNDDDGRRIPPRPSARVGTRVLLLGLAVWALLGVLLAAGPTLNLGGWPVAREFLVAAIRPEFGAEFLALILQGTLVTIAFAVLGAAMAILLGFSGAFLVSQTFWAGRRGRPGAGWLATRGSLAFPRGLHEAVWGVVLVNVLGLDPLVGVLAIGIPFGAMTAKVYADLVDESPQAAYDAIVASGGTRARAFWYGLLPQLAPDMISYAFYRLECSIRSAVILGMIGAGGLGFQLALSFQSLNYGEMWSVIYALVALCAVTDAVSVRVRRQLGVTASAVRWAPASGEAGIGVATRPVRNRFLVTTAAATGVLLAWSWNHLGLHLPGLWSQRTREQAGVLAHASWPPTLDRTIVVELVRLSGETLQMSVLAMLLSTSAGMAVAVLAARPVGRSASWPRRGGSAAARAVLLLCRAVPPLVWALVLLFVLVPGPLPGALALAAYNFGILGRLMAEVVENADGRPEAAIRVHGVGYLHSWLYGTWPQVFPRLLAFGLYRWEVAIRETVIVGLVGAGGLGCLLSEQVAAFDWPGVTSTLFALVLLTFLVDVVSARTRRALR
jgi:phosphonate transport system permease protein